MDAAKFEDNLRRNFGGREMVRVDLKSPIHESCSTSEKWKGAQLREG